MAENSFTTKRYDTGDVIMRQGDSGEHAYIVEEGAVEIFVESEGNSPELIATRGAGSIIGEMALIDNAPRTATVKAAQPSKMIVITFEDLAQRLDGADELIQMVMRVILSRYRDLLVHRDITKARPAHYTAEDIENSYIMESRAIEHIKMIQDIKDALHKDRFELYYQQIIRSPVSANKQAGFEALIRWKTDTGDFIPPDQFIPVAEQSGVISDISDWAVQTTLEAFQDIRPPKHFSDDFFINVNLSAHDITDPKLVQRIQARLESSSVEPRRLGLEITENALIQHPDNARKILKDLKSLGCKIALDDFGTGYSSLSYLHYFPIDKLKIDKSFISKMFDSSHSFELVKAIVSMSKALEIKTVAEGVENAKEAKALSEMGCDYLQGFHFAKPLPKGQIA